MKDFTFDTERFVPHFSSQAVITLVTACLQRAHIRVICTLSVPWSFNTLSVSIVDSFDSRACCNGDLARACSIGQIISSDSYSNEREIS